MRKAVLGTAAILASVGLLAAACGGGGEEKTASQSPATARPSQTTSQSPAATRPSQATASPQPTSAPATALNVAQVNFRFQPDTLAAQTGKAMTVNVVNNGSVSHTFTIAELNVDQTLKPGEKATVMFTPSKAGTFAYYCRFHRSSGMEGKLQVS